MKKIIPMAIVLITLNVSSAFAQISKPTVPLRYVPRDSSQIFWNIGAGFGIPYGTIGGKFSSGANLITGEIGIGILPLAWTPAISLSSVVYFSGRYSAARPKITLCYSNVAGAIVMFDIENFETLYDETFHGIGIYGGVDWRLSKTFPLCLDLNVGWVFPFVGNDEIRRKYDEVKEDLESRGYVGGEEMEGLGTPKISIGFNYAPGRSFKAVYFR
jgi:hypothetical protein